MIKCQAFTLILHEKWGISCGTFVGQPQTLIVESKVESKVTEILIVTTVGDEGKFVSFPNRSRSPRRKKRSPTPRPTKVHVGRLTRNVVKEHVNEIFTNYGAIKSIDMPPDRTHTEFSRGFAYIEYENPDDAEKAIRHMDGGRYKLQPDSSV